ncbi:hypothetical protein [Streptomyces katrae]|uniref:hypothetical protein n=1 Tax=Streptomyces katrae TaxID=68223 RepID=UPI0004C07A86|nr:hypothetical protein [Streptomyces katrae]
MPIRADWNILDLLDAHLEALGDGADLPLPEGLAEPAADASEELVRWALVQLRYIPREPKDAFSLRVGGLLKELRTRRCPWNAAALRLLDDVYTFAATGPRRHENWAHDVLAVLHRSVSDPRGWVRLDWDRRNDARPIGSAYPFDPPAASDFPDRLYPLEAAAALGALAVMAEEWQSEPAPIRTRPDRDSVLADARTLLSRYGPTAGYWTNATAAASDPAPDFLAAGLRGTRSHTFVTSEYVKGLDFLEDLGLIAVTDDEVGVFWSFGAY